MRLVAAVIVSVLAGCASFAPKPDLVTHVETVTVKVPVPVPCVAMNDVPPPFVTSMPATGDVAQLAAGASADLRVLKPRYEAARKLLLQCTTDGGTP